MLLNVLEPKKVSQALWTSRLIVKRLRGVQGQLAKHWKRPSEHYMLSSCLELT